MLLLVALFSTQAFAYFQADLMNAKHNPNAGIQWTLADWLAQKNQMSLMDQWLAVHRSNTLYELNLGTVNQEYTYQAGPAGALVNKSQNAMDYQADFYLSILNLEGEYRKTSDNLESYSGAAGLRLIGTSSRSTSLTARYGWQRRTDLSIPEHWDNQFLEGVLQLYLVKRLGLNGTYRYYFPFTSSQGDELQGWKIKAGIFYEFSIVRLQVNYFKERCNFQIVVA